MGITIPADVCCPAAQAVSNVPPVVSLLMGLRDLPSVDRLARALTTTLPWILRVEIARGAVDEARNLIEAGDAGDAEEIASRIAERMIKTRMTEVINATGVLLHTNLGRAPLHPEAARAAAMASGGYASVELDMFDGSRGKRGSYVETLLTLLTGAEAALIVNNNAGALLLVLMTIGAGREVPVSRGELIEIGGSYRLPELMKASGAVMVEVGTTNRTHLDDYKNALTADTAALLKIHPSNYRVVGFSESVELLELAGVAKEHKAPLIFDAGSGLIDERTPWLTGDTPSWLRDEPGVVQSLQDGADVVLFSGDKLFGGPQAGVIVGSAQLIDRLRSHPAARGLRVDGPTLAAMTVTAEIYANGGGAELPIWQMATESETVLHSRCEKVIRQAGIAAEITRTFSTTGGGTVPGAEIPGPAIRLHGDSEKLFDALLDSAPIAIVARRESGDLIVDLRTVPADRDGMVAEALRHACPS